MIEPENFLMAHLAPKILTLIGKRAMKKISNLLKETYLWAAQKMSAPAELEKLN